jgi:hypothetical protein
VRIQTINEQGAANHEKHLDDGDGIVSWVVGTKWTV